MPFLVLGAYRHASAQQRRALQEQFVLGWYQAMAPARDFADMYARAQALAAHGSAQGYETRLLDEDTESLVVHGVSLAPNSGITIHSTWDEQEGPSVACRFSDAGESVTLAKGASGEVVELGRAPRLS